MKAIILAAGCGKRMRLQYPKCLIKVDGKPLIDGLVNTLKAIKINDISAVVGYEFKKVKNQLVKYYYNDMWYSTEEFYSLYVANKEMDNSIIVIPADIVVSKSDLAKVKKAKGDIVVLFDENGFTGIVKFSKSVCNTLKRLKYHYKQTMQDIITDFVNIEDREIVKLTAKHNVYNLDTYKDLERLRKHLHNVVA